MALLDELKNRLKKLQPAATAGSTGQQEQIANALAAKTGKAAPTSTPRASNQMEQASLAAGAAGQRQIQGQADLGMAQLDDAAANQAAQIQGARSALGAENRMAQSAMAANAAGNNAALQGQRDITQGRLAADTEMKLAETSSKFEQAIKNLASERGIQEGDLFSQFKQENKLLADRQDAAQLEQLAMTMALRDKQYLDQLAEVAAVRNLENEIEFKKEAARLAFGQNADMLAQNAEWQRAYNESDREWTRAMAAMDLNTAMQIANNAAAEKNAQTVFTGATAVAQVGVDAYQNRDTSGDQNMQGYGAGQGTNAPTVDATQTNTSGTLSGPV